MIDKMKNLSLRHKSGEVYYGDVKSHEDCKKKEKRRRSKRSHSIIGGLTLPQQRHKNKRRLLYFRTLPLNHFEHHAYIKFVIQIGCAKR